MYSELSIRKEKKKLLVEAFATAVQQQINFNITK